MEKRNKIIYWISTLWLSLGMVSTGIVQLLQIKSETEFIIGLGFPSYLLPFLGFTKLLGVIVILIPGRLILKEWVYAGFIFMMTGAIYSHIATGEPINASLPPLLLLLLSFISWHFRPENRKLIFQQNRYESTR